MAPDITFEVCYGVSSPWALLGAPRVKEIADKYNLKVVLRPILVLEANGGIPLRTRPQARQDYHALDLKRMAKKLNIPMVPKPKFYPSRNIKIAGQAIIRVQRELGVGNDKVLDFSYRIQKRLWIEEGDVSDLNVLKEVGKDAGISDEVLEKACVDHTGDENDEAVKEWKANFDYCEGLKMFGTPNYVVNGEFFWGQDRLDFVEDRIIEILAESP